MACHHRGAARSRTRGGGTRHAPPKALPRLPRPLFAFLPLPAPDRAAAPPPTCSPPRCAPAPPRPRPPAQPTRPAAARPQCASWPPVACTASRPRRWRVCTRAAGGAPGPMGAARGAAPGASGRAARAVRCLAAGGPGGGARARPAAPGRATARGERARREPQPRGRAGGRRPAAPAERRYPPSHPFRLHTAPIPPPSWPPPGDDLSYSDLKGKVVLITNVACACGLTNSKCAVLGGEGMQGGTACGHANSKWSWVGGGGGGGPAGKDSRGAPARAPSWQQQRPEGAPLRFAATFPAPVQTTHTQPSPQLQGAGPAAREVRRQGPGHPGFGGGRGGGSWGPAGASMGQQSAAGASRGQQGRP
jgi:hypothetical protein